MKESKEACGVLGIYAKDGSNVSPMLISGLQSQQHRGQEAWGIAVPSKVYKRLGLVLEGFQAEGNRLIERFGSKVGIGHVRYSTKGVTTLENAHPIRVGGFSIAHNGTISNFDELYALVKEGGINLDPSRTDTEIVAYRLSQLLNEEKDWFDAFKALGKEVDGAFSFTIISDSGELIIGRDGRGFRPLCIGWEDEDKLKASFHAAASESCAIEYLNARFDRCMEFSDVEPGAVLKLTDEGLETYRFIGYERHAHCPFEYTYFANPSSYVEGINVYQARENCGRELAKMYLDDVDGDVVIPVPDTSRPAAIGFAEEAGLPYREGLMKDRYRRKGSLRSFIEPSKRERIVREMIPIRSIISGKKLVIVDDSIVRGTTSMEIVRRLKSSGAKKIQWFVTFPPIQHPCYQGIDFPTREELIVPRICGGECEVDEANEKVGGYMGVDFLGYNDADALSRGIGLPIAELCLSCATGDYSCLRRKPVFKSRPEMKGE
ncbi:TPA: amidophosphoribosyltransferase [Candidatus Bathyarchaeota archaeon]|nr:amidophosphoribosyltransferase [Candidatus Bathyarchaeota archaeon]